MSALRVGLKEGYAGVGMYSKEEPLSVTYGIGKPQYDSEGRVITAEYDQFYVVTVCTYSQCWFPYFLLHFGVTLMFFSIDSQMCQILAKV